MNNNKLLPVVIKNTKIIFCGVDVGKADQINMVISECKMVNGKLEIISIKTIKNE